MVGCHVLFFVLVFVYYYAASYKPSGINGDPLSLSDAVYCKGLKHLPLQEVIQNHYPDCVVDAEIIRSFIRKRDINRVMQAVLIEPAAAGAAAGAASNSLHKNDIISSLILLLFKIQARSYSHYKESLLLSTPRFQDPRVQAVISSILCFIDQKPCHDEFLPSKEEFYDLIIRRLPYENAVKLIITQHQHRDSIETSIIDSIALMDAIKLDTNIFYHYYQAIYNLTHTDMSYENLFAWRVVEHVHAASSGDDVSPEYELIRGYLLGIPTIDERNSYSTSLGGLRRYSSWRAHNQHPLIQRIIQHSIDDRQQLLLSSLSNCSTSNSTIVVLGDGDFSFSASLLAAWPKKTLPKIVTTTISSEDEFATKYINASMNICRIVSHQSAKILYNIDVTKAIPTANDSDRVVYLFNFPYADTTRVSNFNTVWMHRGRHMELLTKFLRNVYNEGKRRSVHVFITLTGEQLYAWRVGHILRETNFELVDAVPFNATEWNGYERTRSNINSRFPVVSAWTLLLRPQADSSTTTTYRLSYYDHSHTH